MIRAFDLGVSSFGVEDAVEDGVCARLDRRVSPKSLWLRS